MSMRVLKKLIGDEDLLSARHADSHGASDSGSANSNDDVDDDRNEPHRSGARPKKINRFQLLNAELNASDTEAKEDDDQEDQNDDFSDDENLRKHNVRSSLERSLETNRSTDSIKRKRKKKKSIHQPKNVDTPDASTGVIESMDEIESSIREVNLLLGEIGDQTTEATRGNSRKLKRGVTRNILQVQNRNLNPENELKRRESSTALSLKGSTKDASLISRKKAGRSNVKVRKWLLANPQNSIFLKKPGVSMEIDSKTSDSIMFKFVHSRSYQSIQFEFLDAVETENSETLVSLMNLHPNHLDLLIHFSHVVRKDDPQLASELIQRCLTCFESVFHPMFNVASGLCHMDYRIQENRSFFVALFKHTIHLGQQMCHKTGLEFCKLILGLNPDGDPLAIQLMIDHFAMESGNYDFVIDLYEEWSQKKKLSLLPNFRYSVPLAYFLKSQQKSHSEQENQELLKKANEYLEEALLMFPTLLPKLLDKSDVEPDKDVIKCPFFGFGPFPPESPVLLQQLITIYVSRSCTLWKKNVDIIFWLEKSVKSVMERVNQNDPLIQHYSELRNKYYSQGTPRTVLRHIILSQLKDVMDTLPPDVTNSPILIFDPIPPVDSIISYQRPEKKKPISGGPGLLSVFLKSWLPDYNPEKEEAAAAAAYDDGTQSNQDASSGTFKKSISSVMVAMRDLLNNVTLMGDDDEQNVSSDGDVESEPDNDDGDHNAVPE